MLLSFRIIGSLLAWLCLSGAAAGSAVNLCPALAGVERLVAARHRFIVFGEIHGTAEIPALFGDVACHVSKNRPVVVALEWPSDQSKAFEKYIESTGLPSDQGLLTETSDWRRIIDGRSSAAMMSMLESVRRLRASGRAIAIATFQPRSPAALDQSYYELMMASELTRIAGKYLDYVVLALVGRLHAGKKPLADRGGRWPAVMHLPARDVLSLTFDDNGGTAWNCQSAGCKSYERPPKNISPRRISLIESSFSGFDGTFSVGSLTTASPPFEAKPVQ